MSMPHACIGNPCLICYPNQRIAGTSSEPMIDCNLARKIAASPVCFDCAGPHDDISGAWLCDKHWRVKMGCNSAKDAEIASLRAEVERLRRIEAAAREFREAAAALIRLAPYTPDEDIPPEVERAGVAAADLDALLAPKDAKPCDVGACLHDGEDEQQGRYLCDAGDGDCPGEAVTYCSGCECWRCAVHACECGGAS